MKNFLCFAIFHIISLVISGKDEYENLRGVYRIDSLYNYGTLVFNLTSKKFIFKKLSDNHTFKFIRNKNNNYYIRLVQSVAFLAINKNGAVTVTNNLKNGKQMEWEIRRVGKHLYIIQNNYNKKYLENYNNIPRCINNLPENSKSRDSPIKKFLFKFLKFYEEVEITPEHEKIIEAEPIDLVIKYIDLTDPALNRTGIKQIKKDEDHEELRYSIRSIHQYIPWVRKIFILMPNERVRFFKPYEEIKEKIVYVKDKDVLGFDSANIYAFTFNLFRMEKFGLSQNFIYMDDDFFIGQKLKKSNFFYYDETEKKVVPSLANHYFYEMTKKNTMPNYNYYFGKRKEFSFQGYNEYILSVLTTKKFFLDHYSNITLIHCETTHNAIAYNIQDLKEIYDVVINNYEYAREMFASTARYQLTLQTQQFVDLYQLNIKHRKVHEISCYCMGINNIRPSLLNLPMFVINTGEHNYTSDYYINLTKIMKERFPVKSPYENDDVEEKIVNITKYQQNIPNLNTDLNKDNFTISNIINKIYDKSHIIPADIIILIIIKLILYYFHLIKHD